MREVVLFIAMSLDGYIADSKGDVGWLVGQGDNSENPDSYSEFVKDVDTIIMGWNTYHQVVTELSPDEWVYDGFTTYVITHNEAYSKEQIVFTDENPVKLVDSLRERSGKNIWICGGANIVQQLMSADRIDRYHISIIPTLLGSGIRLFCGHLKEQKLTLISERNYDGIIELVYKKRIS